MIPPPGEFSLVLVLPLDPPFSEMLPKVWGKLDFPSR